MIFGSFLPKYFIFDLSIFLFLAGILFLIPKNWLSNIFFCLFLLPQMILGILELTLELTVNDYFVFNMLSLVKDAFTVFKIYYLPFDMIKTYLIFFIIVIPILISLKFLIKKKIKLIKIKRVAFSFVVCGITVLFSFSLFGFQLLYINFEKNSDNIFSAKSFWSGNISSTTKSIKNFGFYGFYINNFYNTYLKKFYYDENFLLKYYEDGQIPANEDAICAGDNLIMICLESFDSFAIDPYNTPNLWKLVNGNSIYMSNFYGKNQTNVSEAISILGFMPNDSIYDAESDSLASKNSLANLFNDLGYTTSYFHSYSGDFYNRKEVMKNMGFQNLYFIEDADFDNISTEFNDWSLETQFFDYFKEEMTGASESGSKFFTYYMTVATHGEYYTNERFQKYYEIYRENFDNFISWLYSETEFVYPEDEVVAERFDNFKAQCIETDEMIGNLFKYLEETEVNGVKLIDNTTVVLFADHDCYLDFISTNVKISNDTDKLYNIPFIIYSKKLQSQTITDFCSTYDIYPTICELFGLAYNQNMCLGDNIFSDDFDSIFYTIKESVGCFDDSYRILYFDTLSKRVDDPIESEDEFMKKVALFMEKYNYINQIYKSKLKL